MNTVDPCPFAGEISPELQPPSIPSSSPYCVCCSFMRASCYTSTHIISCPLNAPWRFTGTSETPVHSSLLLQPPHPPSILLADTVTTAPFMWLPRNTPFKTACVPRTHRRGCYYRCNVLCVHAESDSSSSPPRKCALEYQPVTVYV